jgi:hypothetical protein
MTAKVLRDFAADPRSSHAGTITVAPDLTRNLHPAFAQPSRAALNVYPAPLDPQQSPF